MKFLEDNPRRKFDMEDPHSCVGACYADMEISETFMGPPWFCEFQRKVCRGVWLGQDLLVELRRVRPPIIEGHTRPRR